MSTARGPITPSNPYPNATSCSGTGAGRPLSATRRIIPLATCCRASGIPRKASSIRRRQVNRFLIVRLGSLGDVVHGIPVAAALRQEFPMSRIDWMVDPRYVELLNLVAGLDRRIAVDPRAIKHGTARRRFRQ